MLPYECESGPENKPADYNRTHAHHPEHNHKQTGH